MNGAPASAPCPWHRRARQRLGHSIKWRILLAFLLLALAVTAVFALGAQRAFAIGWRDAARPLLADYVAHLAHEVTGGGPTPQLERARALVQRLPVSLRISGPTLNWDSRGQGGEAPDRAAATAPDPQHQAPTDVHPDRHPEWSALLGHRTADGHRLQFGLNTDAVERRPRFFGMALLALLAVTALVWAYLRHLLRPLDAIGAGAQRFGAGDFSQPIAVRHPQRPDELGQLAHTINTMGDNIQQMLDAKRALLLAISHELRSPLTRARLNAELLPEEGEPAAQRQALLRDLQEMASLISDLLESERLATPHAALQREPIDVPALARSVLADLTARHPRAAEVAIEVQTTPPLLNLDPARLRLLLRNLLDNALRHGGGAAQAPQLRLVWFPTPTDENVTAPKGSAVEARSGQKAAAGTLEIAVRDWGPGVSEAQLGQLAQAFYRPDSARTRAAGGVGLGLYLCRLVAQAHGGKLLLERAEPGLRVVARLAM